MTFEPGDTLCVEGTYASQCFVVAGGHAVVTIDHADVGVVSRDDVVGERGVLLDTVRAATVTADVLTVACAIPRERIETLVDDNRAIRNWMMSDVRAHYPSAGRPCDFVRRRAKIASRTLAVPASWPNAPMWRPDSPPTASGARKDDRERTRRENRLFPLRVSLYVFEARSRDFRALVRKGWKTHPVQSSHGLC